MKLTLRSFPTRDREFATFARTALAVLPEPAAPQALQRALRVRYPAAVVVAEEAGGGATGSVEWHAHRTAIADAPIAQPPQDTPGAWAVIDGERRFLEVSPGLAAIAELPARMLVGRRIEDFSNPADPTIRDDIARLWAEFRARGSLESTLRFNYADGRPRELAYRLVADADGPGRHRLTVHVITGE